MSEINGFDYDIFISYSHDDNYPLAEENGWVDQFHDALENWLQRRRGLKQLSIWRDGELKGNTLFDSEIEKTIKSSALFFVLHSVNYEHSDYCNKELQCFVQHNEVGHGSLKVGEQSRIFHILLNNFPYQNWPEGLAGTSGFVMHDAENEQSLGDFTTPSNKAVFLRQLRKIVDATEGILKQMATMTVRSNQLHQSDQAIDVFIADTADSQTAFRKRLQADLKERGCQVVSAVPPPYSYSEHQKKIKKVIQQAHLTVHLLGEYSGREIQDQENTSYSREQVEIALTCQAKQFLWLPPELEIQSIEDQQHRQWLEQLESGERQKGHYQFIRNNSETAFTNIILQEIAQLKQSQGVSAEEQSFLIDTHQKDQQFAYQLAGLMAANGLNVDFNKESSDPVESMTMFEQSVAKVPNLIITFGQVSPKWLAGRIRQAVKIFASQFEQQTNLQLENIWIFMTPENKGPSSLPPLPPLIPVHLLDNSASKTLQSEIIELLLQQGAEQ